MALYRMYSGLRESDDHPMKYALCHVLNATARVALFLIRVLNRERFWVLTCPVPLMTSDGFTRVFQAQYVCNLNRIQAQQVVDALPERGTVRKPTLRDLWRTDWTFATTT